VLVESGRLALTALRGNVRGTGVAARVLGEALPGALERLAAGAERFDLLFADPPYAWTVTGELLDAARRVIHGDGELALEHSRRTPPPTEAAGWVRKELRRYGESAISFYAPTG
jgi:16S rRNA (guanine966-N2)-methyltransferase